MSVFSNGAEYIVQRQAGRARRHKLNMIIGGFFSGLGIQLLRLFTGIDSALEPLSHQLQIDDTWQAQDFARARKGVHLTKPKIRTDQKQLGAIESLLESKDAMLMRFLENPNLQEHETFTDLIWAVLHLKEEFATRMDIQSTDPEDQAHLRGDVYRAYVILTEHWIGYMEHLKNNYPFLFALALHRSPFNLPALEASST
jgi:hypothetical protein